MTNQEAIDYIEQECRMCKSYSNADNECYALNEACFLSKQLAIEALKVNISAKWISVKDRLPESNGTYLVYAPTYSGGSSSGLDCVNGVMFARWRNLHWSIEIGYHKRPSCVTHWMPLPEAPKEDEK